LASHFSRLAISQFWTSVSEAMPAQL